MPTLAQMFSNCHEASYHSRSDGEVYSKLSEAGFELYCDVRKERSGFFIKFDETSLALSSTQANQEYTLPADLDQIVHLAERVSSTENWRPMPPSGGLENVLVNQLASLGLFSFANLGPMSNYDYYGPFLDAAATIAGAAAQIKKIRISPIPDIARFCQLVYTAKWVPIVNDKSSLMMPDEGTYAMQSKATAKLLSLNGDLNIAATFEADYEAQKMRYLDWVRSLQIQELPTVQPFTDY